MAMCGKCKHSRQGNLAICMAGHEVQFPTLVTKHDCEDYVYDMAGRVVTKTIFNVPEFKYCNECTHELHGVCSGKKWVPVKAEPKCEFYQPKTVTCLHAEPFIQYGNGIRNNWCRVKETHCPWGNEPNHLDCYEPIQEAS